MVLVILVYMSHVSHSHLMSSSSIFSSVFPTFCILDSVVDFPRNSRSPSASSMSSSQLWASWSLAMTPWRSWNYACHPKWKAIPKIQQVFWEKWVHMMHFWGFGWTMESGGALSGINKAVHRLQKMKDAWMTRAAEPKCDALVRSVPPPKPSVNSI